MTTGCSSANTQRTLYKISCLIRLDRIKEDAKKYKATGSYSGIV